MSLRKKPIVNRLIYYDRYVCVCHPVVQLLFSLTSAQKPNTTTVYFAYLMLLCFQLFLTKTKKMKKKYIRLFAAISFRFTTHYTRFSILCFFSVRLFLNFFVFCLSSRSGKPKSKSLVFTELQRISSCTNRSPFIFCCDR